MKNVFVTKGSRGESKKEEGTIRFGRNQEENKSSEVGEKTIGGGKQRGDRRRYGIRRNPSYQKLVG